MQETATLESTARKRKTTAKSKETFTLEAPEAKSVMLLGDFTDWESEPVAMKRQKNGTWKATVSLQPGTYQYRFKVDGEWRDDPDCPIRRANSYGGQNCVREVK